MANLYEQDISSIARDLNPRIDGYFKVIDNIEDFNMLRANFSKSQYESYKYRLLNCQDIMLSYISSGKLAFWVWSTISRKSYYEPEIGHEIAIPDNAVYYFDSHTRNDFQRKGIYAASFNHISAFLEKLNKTKLIFVILTHNKPPIANAKKSNFRIIKKLILINIGISKLRLHINLS
jgi:hypothetical protein